MSDRASGADAVSHASLNGLYVKARELDLGQNEYDAPWFAPPGIVQSDASSHVSARAEDAESHASDAQTHVSDADSQVSAAIGDAQTHASDADGQTHASDADVQTHASDVDVRAYTPE